MSFYDNKTLKCKLGSNDYEFKCDDPVSFWNFIENARNHLAFFGLTASIEIPLNNRLETFVNGYKSISDLNNKLIIDQKRISIRLEDDLILIPKLERKAAQKKYKVLIDLYTEKDNLSPEEINDAFEEFLDMKDIEEKFHLFLENRHKGTELSCEITHFNLLDISEKE